MISFIGLVLSQFTRLHSSLLLARSPQFGIFNLKHGAIVWLAMAYLRVYIGWGVEDYPGFEMSRIYS